MPQTRPIELHFPGGGLVRKSSYQRQSPYTSPGPLRNVRPDGLLEERDRGGSRPGLVRSFNQELGSGNPVNLLNQIREVESSIQKVWLDDLDFGVWPTYLLDPVWTVAGVYTDRVSPICSNGMARSNDSIDPASVPGTEATTLLPTNLDLTSIYSVLARLIPNPADPSPKTGPYHEYEFLLRVKTAVDDSDQISVKFQLHNVEGHWNLSVNQSGSEISTATGGPGLPFGDIRLEMNEPTTELKIYWNGTLIDTVSYTGTGDEEDYRRFGFATQAGQATILPGSNNTGTDIAFMMVLYQAPAGEGGKYNRARTIAASNGVIYSEDNTGSMVAAATESPAGMKLSTSSVLYGAESRGALYIADWEPTAIYTATGGATDGAGTNFSDAGADFINDGVTVGDAVRIVSGNGITNSAGVYYPIAAVVDANNLTLAFAADINGTSIEYEIDRCPKKYDVATDTLSQWIATTGKGDVPGGCKIAVRYRDRIVLSGQRFAPQAIFMSRSGDALDWDYSGDTADGSRAIVAATVEAGLIGDPVTALCPFGDDYLIVGSLRALWVIRGDPGYGGRIVNLSRAVGILSQGAWCYLPDGSIIFLSRDGVYQLAPGANAAPVAVSVNKIPRELKLLTEEHDVSLSYSVVDRGVNIHITHPSLASSFWWLDIDTGGFFQDDYRSTLDAKVSLDQSDSLVNGGSTLFGCADGFIKNHSKNAIDDDGQPFTSVVTIGPFRIAGNDFSDGIVNKLDATLAQDSGNVTWTLITADTAEEAARNAELALTVLGTEGDDFLLTEDGSYIGFETFEGNGVWRAGRNYSNRPRRRGGAAAIVIQSDSSWAMEQIAAELRTMRTQRIL